MFGYTLGKIYLLGQVIYACEFDSELYLEAVLEIFV